MPKTFGDPLFPSQWYLVNTGQRGIPEIDINVLSAWGTYRGKGLVAAWLEKYPNLYFDTAFADSRSTYQPSGEAHARYWSQPHEWQEVIKANPYRFLAALDKVGTAWNSWKNGLAA